MTDYICQHCHQPAFKVRSLRLATLRIERTDYHANGDRHCNPQDPDSPTCHATPVAPSIVDDDAPATPTYSVGPGF